MRLRVRVKVKVRVRVKVRVKVRVRVRHSLSLGFPHGYGRRESTVRATLCPLCRLPPLDKFLSELGLGLGWCRFWDLGNA